MAMNAFASLLCCLGTRRRQGRVQKRPDSRGGKDHVKKSSLRGTRQRSVITRGASVEQHLDTPGPHQPSRWPRLRGMNRVFARSSPARGMTAEAEGVVETRPTADATATAVQAEEQVSDRAGGDGFSSREHGAASTIQAHFRGHLARRAFRALKSLVKLQAFARGSYVRKQANIAIRFMKVLVRLLVRVRARLLLSTQPRNGSR